MIKFLTLLVLNFFDFFHKKKMLAFLKKNRFDNFKIMFDVGAHKGETIELFLKHFKIEKLYSFEASPLSYDILRNTLPKITSKQKVTDICIENIAIGSEIKKIQIKHLKKSSSSTIKDINSNSKYFKKKNFYLVLMLKIFIKISLLIKRL